MKNSLFLSLLAIGMTAAAVGADIVLFDAATADAKKLHAQDGAAFTLADGLLTVVTKPSEKYPGFCLDGDWDLSGCNRIEVEFVDGGIWGQYTLRLLNTGGNPGIGKGSKVFKLPIKGERHAVVGADFPPDLPGLDAIARRLQPLRTWALPYAAWAPYSDHVSRKAPPGGFGQIDSRAVKQVAIYINQPKLPHTWRVRKIVAKTGPRAKVARNGSPWAKLTEENFFPFIDKYGQFKHGEWPDKVHSDADFAVQRAKEEKDLAAHPGPKGWDKWGGWADGPQLPKTGGFSTTKWNGKWWIVDPDGHLWWSHGPVRVTPSSAMTPLATPAGDRAGWFEELPARGDPVFGAFYETRDVLLWPYYGKRGIDRVYDFSAANIRRKYGEKWFETWADLAHRRLRSWSCNTIANSSDKRICLMDRTPYTDRFEIHARPIAGHKGGWWEFCDPFDPSFRAEARRMTEVYRAELADPWCFGFFVDNEHHWGQSHSLALSTLKSPADQPCKAVFRDRMKAKYGDVAKLNAKWKTDYADWDAFLKTTAEPKDLAGARADLEAFSAEIAENYFRTIREELKRANPGKLYLGCRWAGGAPAFTVKAAAKYCDVLSYNVYRREMSEFRLPEGVDAPVMIGEFHFGALDRGPFCPGLILLRDQRHRAQTYKDYVRTSLEHPQIVGVHWHQFSDQATSGRFDGENMQVGWTDVCDTPYWETVEAVREIGSRLYEIRASATRAASSPLEHATVTTTFKNGKTETARVRLARQKDGAWRYELRTIDMPSDADTVELFSDAAVRHAGDPGWWMVDDGRWGAFTHNTNGTVVSHGRMPFFGMKTAEGKAWFAIVKGMRYETNDRIEAKDGEYKMSARLKVSTIEFNPYENWVIDFYELDGDDATYSGMGRLYRKWQLERGAVKPLRERVKGNEALAYAADSFFVRCKFGRCDRTKTTREDWLKAMPPVLVEHTFEDFKDIMRRFKEIGVDKAEMCMVGFQQGGHDGPFPDLFPADERFGGEKGMRDAIAYGKSLGYRMNCHINQNNFYRNAKRWNLADVAKDRDGNPQKYTVYPGGQVYRSCWEVCCNKYVDKDIADEKDLGLNGLFHVDVTSALLPGVCHDPMHPNNRKSMCAWQLRVGEKVRAAFGGYSSECGIDHCAPILDNALYVSCYPGWHSPQKPLVDGYFPIWHVVYSGIIMSQPFYATLDAPCPRDAGSGKTDAVRGSEKVTTFLDTPARRTLKVFELNGRPMFYYTDYKDLAPIKRMYDQWQALKHLQFEFMEDHAEIAPDVFRVRYSNGEEVVCNYADKPFAYRGQPVAPLGFRLYGGNR